MTEVKGVKERGKSRRRNLKWLVLFHSNANKEMSKHKKDIKTVVKENAWTFILQF
jgi:hypothetical protein